MRGFKPKTFVRSLEGEPLRCHALVELVECREIAVEKGIVLDAASRGIVEGIEFLKKT